MSIERVRAYFEKWGLEKKVLEFPVSSATVSEAAQALGCEEKRIAKTMSFSTAQGPVLIVTSGDAKVDNQKFKAFFHIKASMIKPDQLVETIGYPAGGVCPFAVKDGVIVYLDQSLKRFETVFPACGSANSAIELTLAQLEECSCSKEWIDVCKNWQQ